MNETHQRTEPFKQPRIPPKTDDIMEYDVPQVSSLADVIPEDQERYDKEPEDLKATNIIDPKKDSSKPTKISTDPKKDFT